MQIASSGSSSRAAFDSTPRSKASECATDGGPANTAIEESSLGKVAHDSDVDRAGEQSEEPAEREAGDAVNRLAVVGIAVQDAAEGRRVQRQRDADQRDSPGKGALELERPLPAAGSGGLEQ